MRGYTQKTPEMVARAQSLRAAGLTYREIGERLGVSPSTAEAWVSDPDGSKAKARKATYASRCVDCGAPTSGGEGRKAQPRCRGCANRRAAHERTREAILCAIRDLGDEERARRFERERDKWPWATSATSAFGTWNAANHGGGGNER